MEIPCVAPDQWSAWAHPSGLKVLCIYLVLDDALQWLWFEANTCQLLGCS